MNYTLNLLSDRSERVPYNQAEMPIFVGEGNMAHFLNCAASSHWHDDVELCVVLSGKMSYNVNGTVYILGEGEGAFVNSRQFHSNFSPDKSECKYLCVLFHPILLCANKHLERAYVAPLIGNNAFTHVILSPDVQWMAELLKDIKRVYSLCAVGEKDLYLSLQSIFFRIWSILYNHMPQPTEQSERATTKLSMLRDMIGHIQKHHHERITLAEIAAAANICQSSCCIIFNDYVHQTPIQYLIGYRLNRSAELLKDTSMSITEIALATGFAGTSYFSETFRKHFGIAPTAYRKREMAGC